MKDRLKKLPVETTQGTHWTEEATNRRLQLHKKNTEGKPLIKFFEENNVDCKSIPLNWTNNADLIQFVERVTIACNIEWTNRFLTCLSASLPGIS